MSRVSEARQQAFIEAPVEVVWDLISDVDRHPEWWPRVLEVNCGRLEPGCTFRELVQTPIGKSEMLLRVEALDDREELTIRCLNTGTFFQMLLTEAQDGTFIDATFGMEPKTFQTRAFDLVAGRRYFRGWLEDSLAGMRDAVSARANAPGNL